MAKQSGLGSALLVGGYDLSGDIGSLDTISGAQATLDVTSINSSAPERLGGLRSGDLQFTAFFDVTTGHAHPVLSALPTADTQAMAIIGPSPYAQGGPAACVLGRQLNYDGTRGADGSFTFKAEIQSDGYGLEWGELLTAGLRTDTAATNGAVVDDGASSTFGAQAYLQVTAFTGTDVTVKVQHSADGSSGWADLITFTQITSAPGAQRGSAAGTVNEFVRVITATTGGVTSVTFAVMFNRNITAVSF